MLSLFRDNCLSTDHIDHIESDEGEFWSNKVNESRSYVEGHVSKIGNHIADSAGLRGGCTGLRISHAYHPHVRRISRRLFNGLEKLTDLLEACDKVP